ncbi:hypothetical protein WN55_09695 [Dufourea novaeangliae]|uniref:Uncharacterized protein n=1 Tax=Dufourea novaeangliae TaxID=178035 RepID=A0A154NYZ7_DUFNO|nr:hypothetical protein WN55_09695 [Dufourea novaeangliae]
MATRTKISGSNGHEGGRDNAETDIGKYGKNREEEGGRKGKLCRHDVSCSRRGRCTLTGRVSRRFQGKGLTATLARTSGIPNLNSDYRVLLPVVLRLNNFSGFSCGINGTSKHSRRIASLICPRGCEKPVQAEGTAYKRKMPEDNLSVGGQSPGVLVVTIVRRFGRTYDSKNSIRESTGFGALGISTGENLQRFVKDDFKGIDPVCSGGKDFRATGFEAVPKVEGTTTGQLTRQRPQQLETLLYSIM